MKSPKPAIGNRLNEHFALWQIQSNIGQTDIYTWMLSCVRCNEKDIIYFIVK
jgi:hypothetical protein